MLTAAVPAKDQQDDLAKRFAATRELSLGLAGPLSEADANAQSMADASPAKWHLAHTTWFFETFVLRDFVSGYQPYEERWAFLFNSYYEGEGPRHARPLRGLLTRPGLAEIKAWRAMVDYAVLAALPSLGEEARGRILLGIEHEQQHQELLLTDILHLFHANPLLPAMWEAAPRMPAPEPDPIRWIEGRHGIVEIGAETDAAGFAFDCEAPRHPVFVTPHALADRLVTNAEWQDFIADGGYERPEFWLSDGWAWVRAENIVAPLYWRRHDDMEGWQTFAHDGLHAVKAAAPVTHVSYYEADAFARWAGARLPTEGEWEAAAATCDPTAGNQLDEPFPPRPRPAAPGAGLRQMFGDTWQWTGSAYLPYPGFQPAPGAVGEYNGKFMSGQFVLRGASCATPRGHSRSSYRNFFYPHQRWQFTGVRLAKDI